MLPTAKTPLRPVLVGVFILCSVLLPADEVGRIDYLEGIVDIHREGEILELFPSDIGLAIEAVDTIQTGSDGRIEFTMTAARRGKSSINVGPNTAFRVETVFESGGARTKIDLFTGSLALRAARLTGKEEFSIRTESAVMGVRGTSFEVLTAPDGGVLVLCDEGSVSCTDLNKGEVRAYPGQAVEKVPGDSISGMEVDPDSFDEFRQKWRQTRIEIFRSGAPVFIRAYIRQNLDIGPRFDTAYKRLAQFDDRLERYSRSIEQGKTPLGRGDMVRFRAEISPALAQMRSILPFYRQNFFRLQELAEYVTQDGLGGDIRVGDVEARAFFRNFQRRSRDLRGRIARVEHWFKLFTSLSKSGDDPFGGDSLMDDFFAPGEGSLLEEF